MFNYLLLKYTVFYFVFIIYLCAIHHTVANKSDIVSSRQNEPTNKPIKFEQVKRDEKNSESANRSKIVDNSEERIASSSLINNLTVPSKPPLLEDHFNSTANLPSWMYIKEGALQRTGYVALGFMSIVMIFFIVRAVRLRHKKSKSRKYGIITSTVSDMEMEPLDKDDDEEEDTTLFDAQHKYSLQ